MHAVTPAPKARVRHSWKRVTLGILLCAVALALFAYASDYVVFRHRVAGNHQAYGQVTVTPYDAVQHKNGKTEFLFDPPRAETCVHALFPHSGYVPCWYLRRHTEPRTDI
jgi:hypothetical protein